MLLGTSVTYWPVPVVALWGGCRFLWHNLPRWRMYRGLGPSQAEIRPAGVRPGEHLTVRYRIQAHRPLRAEVTLSLVVRELTVRPGSTNSDARTEFRDHLVGSVGPAAVTADPGEWLELEQEFSIPPDGGKRFSTGDWAQAWFLRVRFVLPGDLDLWDEFDVPFDAAHEPEEAPVLQDDYSLYLVKARWFPSRAFVTAVQAVAPHLSSFDVEHIAPAPPTALLERVTIEQAERARARLLAVGGAVEVRRGGEIIPAPDRSSLPIPHVPTGTPHSLPIPHQEAGRDD